MIAVIRLILPEPVLLFRRLQVHHKWVERKYILGFLFIALCMLWLFRSGRILCYSLITNIIPLMVTAGIMGWLGVPLKPSTVLVFSVALGIAVDISIRFLVNYRQELPAYKNDVNTTVRYSIRHTGLSIIYTSMVLIAGFVIFVAVVLVALLRSAGLLHSL